MDREPNPDDWFVEEDPQEPRQKREPPRSDLEPSSADDWLTATRARTTRESRVGAVDRRVVVVAGLLVVALILGLALGGVFSGAGSKVASLPATSATVPGTPTTTQQATSKLRAPSTTLKAGDSGAQVRVLQRALASLGFSPGRIDGRYGPATKDAVARFQRSVRLKADGILGPKTLRALAGALNGP